MKKQEIKNLHTYRDKNKDRNHTINSCEMLQTFDKSMKKSQLQVRFGLLNRRGSPGPAQRFLKFNQPATLTFDSIFYSGAITCFEYPSSNRTLLLQERTGHLRAQPVENHVNPNCFSSSLFFCFEFSSRLPLYTSSQSPVPGSPFPVLYSRYQ